MERIIGNTEVNELSNYKPVLSNKPVLFDSFWKEEKNKMESITPDVQLTLRDYPVPSVEVVDIRFTSWDGTPLKGILVKPANKQNCPLLICFPSFGANNEIVSEHLKWTTLGMAVLIFDLRGQGNSPDYAKYSNGSKVSGVLQKGIYDPPTYYYTNIYRDILLQLKWLKSGISFITPTRLGVMGSSQGGGLALYAAGIDKDINFAIADWPLLAHFEKALKVATAGPYMQIINYLKKNDPQNKTYKTILNTLGYIDCVHFCNLITCPTLMAIGLEDQVTPPLTAFAAFNQIPIKEKKIEVYPQFTHEVNPFHDEYKIAFIMKQLES